MEKETEASRPINKAYFGKSDKCFQYLATISVCFAAVSAGTVLAWSSPALTELVKRINTTNETVNTNVLENFPQNVSSKITLTEKEGALVGSVLNLGALIYAVPTGYIADKFGRKVAIYSSAATFLIGWFFVVIATNLHMILLARFFGGMGLGAICVVAPMYIGEIAENALRATLSSYFQIFLSFGILITFAVGSVTDYVNMSLILAIFPTLLFATFPFMPESHIYLLKTAQTKEAEHSLIRFRGNKRGYDIQGEMQVMNEEIRKSERESAKLTDVFFRRRNRKALVAVLGLLSFQQLCGINPVTFYTQQIFAAAGSASDPAAAGSVSDPSAAGSVSDPSAAGSYIDPSIGAIVMSVVQCIGGYLTMTVIERAGRKYFLILSSVGMMIGLCGLGMIFHVKSLKLKISGFGFLPIGCAALFIVAFTIGYGAVPYMMMHELFTPEVRGIGSGLAIVLAWTISFLVTYLFPISLVVLGKYVPFYILTVINGIAILFVLIFVPETKGKTLLEIQEILEK